MFSAGFLSVLVYGALIWCAISSAGLIVMLVRDIMGGTNW